MNKTIETINPIHKTNETINPIHNDIETNNPIHNNVETINPIHNDIETNKPFFYTNNKISISDEYTSIRYPKSTIIEDIILFGVTLITLILFCITNNFSIGYLFIILYIIQLLIALMIVPQFKYRYKVKQFRKYIKDLCDEYIPDIKIIKTCMKHYECNYLNEYNINEGYTAILHKERNNISCSNIKTIIKGPNKDIYKSNLYFVEVNLIIRLSTTKYIEKNNVKNALIEKHRNCSDSIYDNYSIHDTSPKEEKILKRFFFVSYNEKINIYDNMFYILLSILGLSIFYRIYNEEKLKYPIITIDIERNII
jgi:hypothetical protein